MERNFSFALIKLTLNEPTLTIDELHLVIPEFFEQKGLRSTDSVAITVPGLDRVLRYNHRGELTSEFPTLLEMAKNVSLAAGRSLGALVTGQKVEVPADVLAQRKSACASCEYWNKEKARCKLCGCATNYKLLLAREECPHPSHKRWLAWKAP